MPMPLLKPNLGRATRACAHAQRAHVWDQLVLHVQLGSGAWHVAAACMHYVFACICGACACCCSACAQMLPLPRLSHQLRPRMTVRLPVWLLISRLPSTDSGGGGVPRLGMSAAQGGFAFIAAVSIAALVSTPHSNNIAAVPALCVRACLVWRSGQPRALGQGARGSRGVMRIRNASSRACVLLLTVAQINGLAEREAPQVARTNSRCARAAWQQQRQP